jgi:hypothetical protein
MAFGRRQASESGVTLFAGSNVRQVDIFSQQGIVAVFSQGDTFSPGGDIYYYVSQPTSVLAELATRKLGGVTQEFIDELRSVWRPNMYRAYKIDTPFLVNAAYDKVKPTAAVALLTKANTFLYPINAFFFRYVRGDTSPPDSNHPRVKYWIDDPSARGTGPAPEYLIYTYALRALTPDVHHVVFPPETTVPPPSVAKLVFQQGDSHPTPSAGIKRQKSEDVAETVRMQFEGRAGAAVFMPRFHETLARLGPGDWVQHVLAAKNGKAALKLLPGE